MNFRKGKSREEPDINLIAFIDVLLVILIFLMVTTSYSKFTALQITLPSADAERALDQPREINVVIDAKGRYAVNNVQIPYRDAAGLADNLLEAAGRNKDQTRDQTQAQDPVVIVNADALAAHQTVINVLEAARIAGLAKVTFAAQADAK
ncbi:MAG: ExbD/TolR family protein [Noviherbaspirillum sp.]